MYWNRGNRGSRRRATSEPTPGAPLDAQSRQVIIRAAVAQADARNALERHLQQHLQNPNRTTGVNS